MSWRNCIARRSEVTESEDTMELKPGSRWQSAVCDTEVVVVRPPASPVAFHIGGAGALPAGAGQPTKTGPDAALADGTLLGKRYADEATGLQLLCTRPGIGTITIDGRKVTVVAPRQMPASD
jgi:hypothetical protein